MPIMREVKTPLTLVKIRYFKDEKGLYYKKIGKNHRKKVRPFWKMKRIVIGTPVMLLIILGFNGYKVVMNLVSENVVNELTSQMTKEEYDNILKDSSVQQIVKNEIGTDNKSDPITSNSSGPVITDVVSEGNDPAVTNVNDTSKEEGTDDVAKAEPPKEKDSTAINEDSSKDNTEKKTTVVEKEEPKMRFNSRDEVMKFLLSKFSMGELSAFAKKAQGGLTTEEKAEIKSTVLGRLSPEEYNAVKVYAAIEISNRQ